MPSLEFNTKNFFNDLIFHPEHGATQEDKNKALACSILFGVCTLGIGPAIVGLYQLGRWYHKKEENIIPVDETVKNIATNQGRRI